MTTHRSTTTWRRIEPSAKQREMQDGIQAPVSDPLWMLARQWQVGEFRGEDAGSIAEAKIWGSSDEISRYRPEGDNQITSTSIPYDSTDDPPLEVIVERETVRPSPSMADDGTRNIRDAVEAGVQFRRLLRNADLSLPETQLIQWFGLEDSKGSDRYRSSDDDRFISVVSGRTLNGDALYATLRKYRSGTPVSDLLPIPSDKDPLPFEAVVDDYLNWYEMLYTQPSASEETAWDSERMEFRFSIAGRTRKKTEDGEPNENATEETVLTASEHSGGRLDWTSFSLSSEKPMNVPETDARINELDQSCFPTPITFRGAPQSRWWEFEDAQVDVNRFDIDRTDLARLLLSEFLLIYGNDWFVVPLELPIGSYTRIFTLKVTDTFGEETTIAPTQEKSTEKKPWRMFTLSSKEATNTRVQSGLFLPPTVVDSLESNPVEEVRFSRDEMANLVWAIERTIEGVTGGPVNRTAEVDPADPETGSAFASGETDVLRPDFPTSYRLASTVRSNWYPLLPVRHNDELWLERGVLFDSTPSTVDVPLGRILDDDLTFRVRSEEIPREGIDLTRSYQYTRGVDGRSYLWSNRQKHPGTGETSSGIQYDILEEGK